MLKPHPKWGMNPTHLGCYVCSTRFDEVYLFGDSMDAKAPPISLFPPESPQHRICPVCEEHMEKGLLYMLVQPTKVEMSRNQNDELVTTVSEHTRTGVYLTLREDQVRELYGEQDEEFYEELFDYRIHLLTEDTWEQLGFPDPKTIMQGEHNGDGP